MKKFFALFLIFTLNSMTNGLAMTRPIFSCSVDPTVFGFNGLAIDCDPSSSTEPLNYQNPIDLRGCHVSFSLGAGVHVSVPARVVNGGRFFGSMTALFVFPKFTVTGQSNVRMPQKALGFRAIISRNEVKGVHLNYCFEDHATSIGCSTPDTTPLPICQ